MSAGLKHTHPGQEAPGSMSNKNSFCTDWGMGLFTWEITEVDRVLRPQSVKSWDCTIPAN